MGMIGNTLVFAGLAIGAAVLFTPNAEEAGQTNDVPETAGFDGTKPSPTEPQAAIASSSGRELVLKRDASGHFTTTVTINGARFPVLVDSGATLVVLRREDAMAAGISVFPHEFTGGAQTAGGEVRTKPVVLSSVRIGDIERSQVPGAVVDADLPVSLLGQSFLNQLAETRVSDGEMRLR